MNNKTSFRANVCFNNKQELVCFCYIGDKCACLEKTKCFEAQIEVSILKEITPLEKMNKDLESFSRELNKKTTDIKKGLSHLEKAIRKNKSFK